MPMITALIANAMTSTSRILNPKLVSIDKRRASAQGAAPQGITDLHIAVREAQPPLDPL